MRVAALVPARAGSKGISGKNRREYQGIRLWRRAVDCGYAVAPLVVVSTDDEWILGQWSGARIIERPSGLATDDTPMLAVVQHAMEAMENPDVVLLLQPTQPLREERHVRTALRMLVESDATSVVSVVEVPAHFNPSYVCEIRDGRLAPFEPEWASGLADQRESFEDMPTRRQDCQPAYYRDGTVYAIRRETIEAGSLYGDKCLPLVIPASESCTLDTEDDWARLMAREVAHA